MSLALAQPAPTPRAKRRSRTPRVSCDIVRRMSNAQTYSGSCHCGNVRYEAEMDLSGKVIACNCSMCRRKGSLLSFVPAARFKLLAGEGAMTNYQFNKKVIDHLFCSTCGVTSFARGRGPDGSQMIAINARCLDGVDAAKLDVAHYDGANL
jgi:hypothetical protein